MSALDNFRKVARMALSNLDTPIESCTRMGITGSGGPNLYIKRDDFIGSLVWGNKLRKLEYALAEAIALGADTVITCGAVQSNHARITAQVCARLGLQCILVQNGEPPQQATGNHKINKMLGVPIHYVDSREQRDIRMREIEAECLAKGLKPYLIPLGASNAIGCLGFVNAMEELKRQQELMNLQFDYIFHATSSGGTQAGMEIGKRLLGMEHISIIGISADNSADQIAQSVLQCAQPVLANLETAFEIRKEELFTDTSFVGPGYGLASEASMEAIRLFAHKEGVLLDNTYTAKAAAGVLEYMRSGRIPGGKNVLFWHTGGLISEL